ncbi:MAG: hypothetical protein LBM13_02845, partial [Candidatus Ancillula sp.]|nr:hypothetical protein [Candidatus Ancillula sp.]
TSASHSFFEIAGNEIEIPDKGITHISSVAVPDSNGNLPVAIYRGDKKVDTSARIQLYVRGYVDEVTQQSTSANLAGSFVPRITPDATELHLKSEQPQEFNVPETSEDSKYSLFMVAATPDKKTMNRDTTIDLGDDLISREQGVIVNDNGNPVYPQLVMAKVDGKKTKAVIHHGEADVRIWHVADVLAPVTEEMKKQKENQKELSMSIDSPNDGAKINLQQEKQVKLTGHISAGDFALAGVHVNVNGDNGNSDLGEATIHYEKDGVTWENWNVPDVSGHYTFTVTATDRSGHAVTQSRTLDVDVYDPATTEMVDWPNTIQIDDISKYTEIGDDYVKMDCDSKVKPGSVLRSWASQSLPDGLLVKVTSVDKIVDGCKYTTQKVDMSAAVQHLHVDKTVNLADVLTNEQVKKLVGHKLQDENGNDVEGTEITNAYITDMNDVNQRVIKNGGNSVLATDDNPVKGHCNQDGDPLDNNQNCSLAPKPIQGAKSILDSNSGTDNTKSDSEDEKNDSDSKSDTKSDTKNDNNNSDTKEQKQDNKSQDNLKEPEESEPNATQSSWEEQKSKLMIVTPADYKVNDKRTATETGKTRAYLQNTSSPLMSDKNSTKVIHTEYTVDKDYNSANAGVVIPEDTTGLPFDIGISGDVKIKITHVVDQIIEGRSYSDLGYHHKVKWYNPATWFPDLETEHKTTTTTTTTTTEDVNVDIAITLKINLIKLITDDLADRIIILDDGPVSIYFKLELVFKFDFNAAWRGEKIVREVKTKGKHTHNFSISDLDSDESQVLKDEKNILKMMITYEVGLEPSLNFEVLGIITVTIALGVGFYIKAGIQSFIPPGTEKVRYQGVFEFGVYVDVTLTLTIKIIVFKINKSWPLYTLEQPVVSITFSKKMPMTNLGELIADVGATSDASDSVASRNFNTLRDHTIAPNSIWMLMREVNGKYVPQPIVSTSSEGANIYGVNDGTDVSYFGKAETGGIFGSSGGDSEEDERYEATKLEETDLNDMDWSKYQTTNGRDGLGWTKKGNPLSTWINQATGQFTSSMTDEIYDNIVKNINQDSHDGKFEDSGALEMLENIKSATEKNTTVESKKKIDSLSQLGMVSPTDAGELQVDFLFPGKYKLYPVYTPKNITPVTADNGTNNQGDFEIKDWVDNLSWTDGWNKGIEQTRLGLSMTFDPTYNLTNKITNTTRDTSTADSNSN